MLRNGSPRVASAPLSCLFLVQVWLGSLGRQVIFFVVLNRSGWSWNPMEERGRGSLMRQDPVGPQGHIEHPLDTRAELGVSWFWVMAFPSARASPW